MKCMYRKETVQALAEKMHIDRCFTHLPDSMHLIEYEAGETVVRAFEQRNLLQILIQGEISISYIREDGNVYALAHGEGRYIIGDMELFMGQNPSITAVANGHVVCLAVSLDQDGGMLLGDNVFLRMIARELAKKIQRLTDIEAKSSTLKERVANYMTYYCKEQVLCGVEKSAFHLHCSPRQLQRILNELAADGQVRKIGKGCYRLICAEQAKQTEGLPKIRADAE